MYWAATFHLSLWPALLALPFLSLRWMRREVAVEATVAATLLPLVFAPAVFWLAAAMAAATLALVAYRGRLVRFASAAPDPEAAPAMPYRTALVDPAAPPAPVRIEVLDDRARARLAVGATICAYLAAWTFGWTGGALPAHQLWLDLLLAAVLVAAARGTRRPFLALPVLPVVAHGLHAVGWLPTPGSTLEWGYTATAAGFATLAAALATTRHLARRPP